MTKLKTLYCGYEKIILISDQASQLQKFSKLLDVSEQQIEQTNRADYLAHQLIKHRTMDLLVIDVDSVGVDDAGYLHFLATCFLPATPVVMIATDISAAEQTRLMSSGEPTLMKNPNPSHLLSPVT